MFAYAIASFVFLLYVYFVLAYGVNVPFWDDWELLDQVRQIQSGQLHWWKLIVSKHNEHLMGTAFVLETWQLLATDFNYKLQLVTGVLLQAVTFGVLTGTARRHIAEDRRPWWLTISALIWFSLAQYKDLLWAFQTAWFLISFCLATCLGCLHKAGELENAKRKSGPWFAAAIIVALISSFASLHGIIVWLAGAVYLLGRQAYKSSEIFKDSLLRKWLVSASLAGLLVTCVWIKMGGGFTQGPEKFSLSNLLFIFVGVHGDFWGNVGASGLIWLGIEMLGFVCLALVKVLLSKEKVAYALPVALITFGICFVAMVAVGRVKFGVGPASDSHYTAYSLLTYFGVLSILMRRDETLPATYPVRWAPLLFSWVIALAACASYYDATLQGIAWRSDQGMNAALLLKYREEPDFVLARTLFGDPAMVRRNAEFLEAQKLGAFKDADAVPEAVKSYTNLPKSMQSMIVRHPEQQKAIERAWQVYEIGSDLRRAFNPISEQFAHNLLDWCANTSQTSSSHYLSQYLTPFAADYVTIKASESSNPDPH